MGLDFSAVTWIRAGSALLFAALGAFVLAQRGPWRKRLPFGLFCLLFGIQGIAASFAGNDATVGPALLWLDLVVAALTIPALLWMTGIVPPPPPRRPWLARLALALATLAPLLLFLRFLWIHRAAALAF